jgi:hypothetical protein
MRGIYGKQPGNIRKAGRSRSFQRLADVSVEEATVAREQLEQRPLGTKRAFVG